MRRGSGLIVKIETDENASGLIVKIETDENASGRCSLSIASREYTGLFAAAYQSVEDFCQIACQHASGRASLSPSLSPPLSPSPSLLLSLRLPAVSGCHPPPLSASACAGDTQS